MTAYHAHAAIRAHDPIRLLAGTRCHFTMANVATSMSKRDAKREVDSKAEVDGS